MTAFQWKIILHDFAIGTILQLDVLTETTLHCTRPNINHHNPLFLNYPKCSMTFWGFTSLKIFNSSLTITCFTE